MFCFKAERNYEKMKKDINWKSVIKAAILHLIIGSILYYVSILIPELINIKFPEESAENPLSYMNHPFGLFATFLNIFILFGGSSLLCSAIFFYVKKLRLKDLTSDILLKTCVLLVPSMVFALFLNGSCFLINPSTLLPYLNVFNSGWKISYAFQTFLIHLANFIIGFLVANCLQYIMEDSE